MSHKLATKWRKKSGYYLIIYWFKLQSYTLTGLKTYTQYLVSLKVFNPEGTGPETVVVVMTDEGGKWSLSFISSMKKGKNKKKS